VGADRSASVICGTTPLLAHKPVDPAVLAVSVDQEDSRERERHRLAATERKKKYDKVV
jgi:hypothetical protein